MKTAAAIKTLADAAAQHGGTVEDDSVGRTVTLQVCAPAGMQWAANSAQHIVVSTYRGPQEWLDTAVKFGLEDILAGVEPLAEE